MDEGLDYNSDASAERDSSDQWLAGRSTASSATLDREGSTLLLQYKNYHLHLVRKRVSRSLRPIIPSTKNERLAFYRSYTTSAAKLQVACMQTSSFNKMIWVYLFNAFFKSLPHTYIQIFLAAYAPEEHLYLSKMVPFFQGFKLAFVLLSMLEIFTYMDHCVMITAYLCYGLLFKNPWNRCTGEYTYKNMTVNCYDIEGFANHLKNVSWTFHGSYYVSAEGELFQLAQIEFTKIFMDVMNKVFEGFLWFFVWAVVLVGVRLVKTKRFWKILHNTSWILIFTEVATAIYLILQYLDRESNEDETKYSVYSVINEAMSNADIDFLAESMTAPPVIHFLTSRSTQEIEPSHDSSVIVFSNNLQLAFRGLLAYKLRLYCQNMIGASLRENDFNTLSTFYMWPMFLSTFYLGDLYTLAYFALHSIMDLLTIIVTYHCFMEVLVCEWKFVKRWIVNIIMIVIGSFFFYFDAVDGMKIVLLIFFKSIITFAEVLAIYGFYPVGRLVDDITFHNGTPPTTLRILCLRLMPIFYFVKIYVIIDTVIVLLTPINAFKHINKFWIMPVMPFIIGMLYVTFIYSVKLKRGLQRMFVPDINWGPEDQEIRQLRKEYDSRYFIGSQSDRRLSRYMIEKTESKAFQLDLNYDPNRRPAIATSMFRFESEKKNL